MPCPALWTARAKGSGAPPGTKNALKHGLMTQETRDMLRLIRRLERCTREIIDEI